jgi:iron complex transport system ATP-binding protein
VPAGVSPGPELETRTLDVRYPGSPELVLRDVSMAVAPGTLYSVLGPNGAGKSSLIRALLGLVRPARGEAFLAGVPAADWRPRERARRVGVVPQSEAFQFPMTVEELVSMGRYPYLTALSSPTAKDRSVVADALTRCDAAELAPRPVDTLSGGELQRVRIARALAQEPSTLILDEPTASLDLSHEMEIMELLRDVVSSGRTVLMTTHHLDLAGRYSDRLLLLNRGAVAAEGTPAEVLNARDLERVFGWPVTVTDDPVTGTPRVTPLARER